MAIVTKRRLGIGLGVLAAALVTARVALPYVVEDFVNRKLAENPQYRGSIEDVDIWLIRGAYVIEGLELEKIDGEAPVPFLDVRAIDLSLEWRSLLHRKVVAEVELHEAKLNFVNGDTEAEDQAGTGVDWRDEVQKLVPIRINRFAVLDSEVHYADFGTAPPIDVYLEGLDLEARNLTNSEDSTTPLPATIDATAGVMERGAFTAHVKLDPFATLPTFDLNVSMEHVPLVEVNDLLAGYGKFDAEGGRFDLFCELAAKDGRFSGYVKPLLTDAQVFRLQQELDEGDGPVQLAWEALVGVGKEVLENRKVDRVATKVPIDGSFDDPKIATWSAVWSAVNNAFVEALFRGIDGDVTFAAVGGEPTVSEKDPREARREARARRKEERGDRNN